MGILLLPVQARGSGEYDGNAVDDHPSNLDSFLLLVLDLGLLTCDLYHSVCSHAVGSGSQWK